MKRHDLDLLSLIAGGFFAVMALAHLVGTATDERANLTWLGPAVLLGLGVAGLAGAMRGSRSRGAGKSADDG